MAVSAFEVINSVPRPNRSDDFVREEEVDAADAAATDAADAAATDARGDFFSACCSGTERGGRMMLL